MFLVWKSVLFVNLKKKNKCFFFVNFLKTILCIYTAEENK